MEDTAPLVVARNTCMMRKDRVPVAVADDMEGLLASGSAEVPKVLLWKNRKVVYQWSLVFAPCFRS